MHKQPDICREKKPMPITLNSTLEDRARGIIQGCVHCTTIPALCSILQTGTILCSNDVRQAQDRQDIPRTISSRDRNKPGANGVYARFLLRQKTVPFAEFGTSGARPVRIIWQNRTVLTCQLSVQP